MLVLIMLSFNPFLPRGSPLALDRVKSIKMLMGQGRVIANWTGTFGLRTTNFFLVVVEGTSE